MRTALWPDDHEAEVDAFLAGAGPHLAVFVAERSDPETGRLYGFAEVGLRGYAEGCLSTPVGYLEGIWVDADARGRGIGRALVMYCERWAIEHGCVEFASDAVIDNAASHAFHRAIGFEEAVRLVCYRRPLANDR